MRILVWCRELSPGGITRLLVNLIPSISRQAGVKQVRLVVSRDTHLKTQIDLSTYPKLDIVHFDGTIDTTAAKKFLDQCDVVYFFWTRTFPFPPIHKPTVCTFQDTIVLDYPPPFAAGSHIRDYWNMSKAWLDQVTVIAVPSDYVRAQLVVHFGQTCQRAMVVPHAISPAGATGFNSSPSKRIDGLPERYFLYIANTSPHKNHYNLLLAFSKFAHRAQLPLVLIGDHIELLRHSLWEWPELPSIPTLLALIHRTGLRIDEDIFPMGYISDCDVANIMQNSRALIMASLAEGGGSYPVEEALNMGIPVLCSDIPVMREHLSRRTADIAWFDPESPDCILQALNRMYTEYDHFKASAMRGINDRKESWDDVGRKYVELFRMAQQLFHTG